MARIIRTEQLSIDGDKVRITSDENGNMIINSVDGDVLTPIISTNEITSDVSSLAILDQKIDSDISSLASVGSSNNNVLNNLSDYTAYSMKTDALDTGEGSSSQTITLTGRSFNSQPNVFGVLQGGSDDPILSAMVTSISETATPGIYQATFQFTDELPATGEAGQSTNYTLNIMALESS